MGLGDVWVDIQEFWIDISEYSTAEINKDKYKKIAEKLDKKITSCEESLENAGTCGSSIHESFTSNESAAKGKWKEKFDKKEKTWNKNRKSLTKKMKEALKTAKERRDQAKTISDEWAQAEADHETRIRGELEDKREERRIREKEAREAASKAARRKW